MHNSVGSIVVCLIFASAAACSDSSSPAGAAGAGGTTGSGGFSGAGGNSGATVAGTGGTSAGSGGAPTQMDSGSADTAVGDGATNRDAPATGDAMSSRPPKPSAGCGKINPPTGARTIMTGGQQANFVVNLPPGYDPNKPMPLGFAFHGFGNPVCTGACVGFKNLSAVTVFPKSLQAGWEGTPEPLASNLQFFEDLVVLMKNEYCVDENRIFVAGVSSGGQFVEHLACRDGDWLWQVTPVSAFVDRGVDTGCKGTPPVLVIHGVTDKAGNYGQDVAQLYAKRNGCSANLPAGLAQARTDMMAAFNAMRAEYRCLDWDGCTANPVRYCISSQITYSGLTHGWPRVGGMLIADFQSGLK